MAKLRVFVSSVQNELSKERAAILQVITVDLFLNSCCEAILYDKTPTTGKPSKMAYLELLKSCKIYLLIIDVEYGRLDGNLSATHTEYRQAQNMGLPTAVFIRGLDSAKDKNREARTEEFINEIIADDHRYSRFHDREDLKPAVRKALHSILKNQYNLMATQAEECETEHQIETASRFETNLMDEVTCKALDKESLSKLVEIVIEKPGLRIFDDAPEHALMTRGLAISHRGKTATVNQAAFILFHPHPANRFPQCEILADAYEEPKISSKPKGQETINASLMKAVEQTLVFIDKHTFHPRRVVGLNNLRLNEYPNKALREIFINALAHRNYEDATRKVMLRIFSDRIEIASPGYPLKPLTLAKLQKGNYRPCSRNPLITQTLALLGQMEQRGTGFARMREAMLDHGLEPPTLSQSDGYFVVTLHGPNGDYERLRVPIEAQGFITPAVEAELNERQKKIMLEAQKSGSVTSGWCKKAFEVAYNTTYRDLSDLVKRNLLVQVGKGRATRYELIPGVR